MKKLIFITIILCLSFIGFSQYKINIKINNYLNSELFLGYHYGIKTFIIDTIKTDKNGNGIFSGDKKLHSGIYFIAFSSMDYFDILINENQEFSLTTDTTNFLNTLQFKNSAENDLFINYRKRSAKTRNSLDKLHSLTEKYKHIPDSVSNIKARINNISNAFMRYKADIAIKNSSSLFAKILYSMSEPLMPKIDATKLKDYKLNPDSVVNQFMYYYYKNHYFDNFDFTDPRLLYTSILPTKINTFYSNVVPPFIDSLKLETAKLVSKAYSNNEAYQYTLNYLLSIFESSGKMANDQLFVFVAENYLLRGKTDWLSKEFLKQLSLRVKSIKPNMTGKMAPNLILMDDNDKEINIHNINSDYIVLYFWDTKCEHCKIMTPIIHDIVKKYENIVQFVAICTETDKQHWLDFIEKENLHDWINAHDPSKKIDIISLYDIYKTPRVYLLNNKKTIITKDIEPEELESYLDVMFKK